ncbi:chlororespiratory reduction protein 7 [Leptolyngbya sp. PCC 6406]|uniref:chlororespiratory reduction protein 7 n=1 Tax=Leptolyngbya sp. PCC 6406 TaxID=1173264 RepID=UPI0002ACF3EB|nr:chlororespiratory reduction protein 7 [Leptolyngbya sp. PCC 6406]
MAHPLMYQEEMFVLLVPGQEEEILSAEELLERLQGMLGDHQDDLPRDLAKFATIAEQARCLRDTACEFEQQPGQTWQWYAIRLEK